MFISQYVCVFLAQMLSLADGLDCNCSGSSSPFTGFPSGVFGGSSSRFGGFGGPPMGGNGYGGYRIWGIY